jgi:hypothetical protein
MLLQLALSGLSNKLSFPSRPARPAPIPLPVHNLVHLLPLLALARPIGASLFGFLPSPIFRVASVSLRRARTVFSSGRRSTLYPTTAA